MTLSFVQPILRVGRSLVFLSSLTLLLLPIPSRGQQVVSATLFGAVTDQAGAAVPEAAVTVTNVGTSIATKTTSDSTGNYIFPSLPPGTYNLTAEKQGFKATVLTGITLLVNQQARIDLQLQVGAMTTTVEVRGAAPLVQTSTASVGTVVEGMKVVQLPLNLRRFGALAVMVPGTVIDNGGFANSNIGSPFSETSYAANGARSASNNILIDGSDSRNLSFGGFAIQPPPDAVQEFKIQTNIYDAAFGKTAGSTINVVLRSGTNQLHGGLWEFLRNDKLDARNFFANDRRDPSTGREIPGTARPEFRRNQFGAAAGGPIIKNKTFVYGSFELLRQVKGLSAGRIVPTDAQKKGDFSTALTGKAVNLCGGGGPSNLVFDTGQLFDAATLSKMTCPSGSGKAGQTILVGTPFPGNILTKFDPVAVSKLVPFYPEPNRPGIPNFLNQLPDVRNDYQFSIRIDHNIGPNDQLFGHYLFAQSRDTDPTAGTGLPGFGDVTFFRGHNAALGWTHTFGPTLLNEARFGFQRDWDIRNCLSCPRSPGFMAGLGIKNFQALSPSREGVPVFSPSGFQSIGDANYRPVISPDMVEKYQDNLTWTRGRHTIVAGVDWQFWQVLAEEAAFSPHGQYVFDGRYSSLANETPDARSVAGFADFLQGFPSQAARTLRFLNTNQVGGWFLSLYGQDNIKVSPNFTINLGLRWEFRRPAVDKRNNFVTFFPLGQKFSGPGNGILVTAADDPLNDSFCTDPAFSYLKSADGRCLVATSAMRRQLGFTGRTRRSLVFNDFSDFAPRIGITWRPTASDKLILHTGYGIFYDLANFNNQHFVDNNPVFSPSQRTFTAFGDPVPRLPSGELQTIENIFLGGKIPSLTDQFVSLYVSPNYRPPYFQQWNFGVESQLADHWAWEVNYIGTKGTHLGFLHLFANQPEPGLGPLQPRRPYPDLSIMLFTTPDSDSNYHSLQTKLTKRFSNGFTFLTAYTWAHSIDDNEGDEGFGGGVGNAAPQDDNNLRAERGRAFTDAHQRFSFSGIWDLPVGKGRRFLNQGGVASAIMGGWEATGIVALQSGFPFSLLINSDPANTGGAVRRPDRSCDGAGKRTVDDFYNQSCFTTALLDAARQAGQPRFGNSGRNILTGPGIATMDLGLFKEIRLSDRFKLEFRSEFFNIFNHPIFGNPSAAIDIKRTAGKIFGTRLDPRDIQFGLKLLF